MRRGGGGLLRRGGRGPYMTSGSHTTADARLLRVAGQRSLMIPDEARIRRSLRGTHDNCSRTSLPGPTQFVSPGFWQRESTGGAPPRRCRPPPVHRCRRAFNAESRDLRARSARCTTHPKHPPRPGPWRAHPRRAPTRRARRRHCARARGARRAAVRAPPRLASRYPRRQPAHRLATIRWSATAQVAVGTAQRASGAKAATCSRALGRACFRSRLSTGSKTGSHVT